ncbi:MAG: PilZ domain-containing protein [Kofleriaceae bacterium]|nr:PilZ domain-containing protein [Myxococcales bacterium]MCB9564635.1 PilZ domain-containing protein [Kofleriaceae bacterium]MCB9573747.1 PilZ domain-containing protein [Kofleriaceae bacterium]
MADNRRTSTRHEVDIAARIKVGAEPEDCRIGNLSMGGAFMMMRRLPMGERVTVYFRLPTHDSEIEAVGTIRWSTDQGVGVQFDGLRARETWALGKYLESLPSAP